MVTFEYISARGDILNLTNNDFFTLTNIDAQTTAETAIASAVAGGSDGDNVTNIRVTPRTIIFDFRLKGNIEESKREILRFVKIKQKCTIKWTQNNRTVEINGVVESIDMPRWNNGTTMQIAIYCSNPYWENADGVVDAIGEMLNLHYFTSALNDMLYFPFEGLPFGEFDFAREKSFFNDGDVDVGVEIEITATGTVTNPIITNANGDYFGIGSGTGNSQVVMHEGDIIVVKTGRNQKSVIMNGTTNLLSKIKPLSTWLQAEAGDNSYTINTDDEALDNVIFSIKFKQRYI